MPVFTFLGIIVSILILGLGLYELGRIVIASYKSIKKDR